ncbi:MAG: response associated peptidase [Betaproteobacteria bacterium]|nr:response associated peptidase [Betaproteobacteria bacterium]
MLRELSDPSIGRRYNRAPCADDTSEQNHFGLTPEPRGCTIGKMRTNTSATSARTGISRRALCSKILRQEFGRPQFVSLRWSLVPFWANDCRGKVQPINAQCETAAEEPMFRKLMRERRSRRLAFIKPNWQVAQIATS